MFMEVLQKYYEEDLNYVGDSSSYTDYITTPVCSGMERRFRRIISGDFVRSISRIVKIHNPYLIRESTQSVSLFPFSDLKSRILYTWICRYKRAVS